MTTMRHHAGRPGRRPSGVGTLPGRFSRHLTYGVAWITLIVSLALTLAGWHLLQRRAQAEAALEFRARVDEVQARILRRMLAYEQMLRGAAGLFAARPDVDRLQWRRYVETLDLEAAYPGTLGLGFARHVTADGLAAHQREVRDEGFPGYAVQPPGARDEMGPIVFIEPFTGRNLRAFGFDMLSEPVRRAAMLAARDTGRPTLSGRVTLVQESAGDTARQNGFLFYLPVYEQPDAMPPGRGARAAPVLRGWVYSPLRAGDMMRGVLGQGLGELSIALHDGPPSPDTLLFAEGLPQGPAAFSTERPLDLPGRTWTLRVASTPLFDQRHALRQPDLLLASGVLASLLLFGIVMALAGTRMRALRLAQRMTDELRASNETLEARVRERTVSLEESNRQLAVENAQRRAAEQERVLLLAREQRARADAEAADRAKDEMLAVVSHELRTPLNAIQGWLHILRRKRPVDDATLSRAIDVIQRNLDTQVQVVEDLLDTARIASGKLRLELRPVELGAVVRAAVDVVRPMAESRGLLLTVEVPGAPLEIMGDAHRLEQVVWNLLSNAVKFSGAGDRIDVRLEGGEGTARLDVRDTGRGIDPAFLPRLFERFSQVDQASTRSTGGLGLGLALVRHIVEGHRGTVSAHSDGPGSGARFVVEIPTRRPGDAEHGQAAAPVRDGTVSVDTPIVGGGMPASAPSLDGLRVLVVEDHDDARELLAELLRAQGAEVRAAGDGPGALGALGDGPDDGPHLLICDIALPGEDGRAVLARLRERESALGRVGDQRLVAVALSAFARDEDRRRSLEAGFVAHLAKPLEPEALMTLLRRLAPGRSPY